MSYSNEPKFKKDVKAIKRYLEKQFPEGVFTSKQVLELARPKNSPIHQYFDWDDSHAAELYRLEQARQLIQCVVSVWLLK